MFGFGVNKKIEKDAKIIAEAIQKVASIIHASSSFDEMRELLEREEFEKFEIVSDELDHIMHHKKILFFRSSNANIKNFKFWITYKEQKQLGNRHSLMSENTGDYFGVMILWSDVDDANGFVSVELSDIAIKQRTLGKHARELAHIMLKFPGFTNQENMWKID
ncbi:MAG: hypothetical protein WCD70_08100 [Alphaproteobacteria bacterium]